MPPLTWNTCLQMPLFHIVCGPFAIIVAAIILGIRLRVRSRAKRANAKTVLPLHEHQAPPPACCDIKEKQELAVVVAEIPCRVQKIRPRLNSFCGVGDRFGVVVGGGGGGGVPVAVASEERVGDGFVMRG
ncbi:hypothetical protein BZA05DRAFT_419289 [Tricharina praecox]|uniref:uncharacterized protein n=1 Tax=Tricharina praecox TaxID=43433 RepID=UPI00221E3AAC|nr:uncharacterized protein BZA05DRAFT_419289 [Tricharina praecox]KAI5850778.1 hypothetical protein BZA05DRAFT_419289 [Tricharina praecox]